MEISLKPLSRFRGPLLKYHVVIIPKFRKKMIYGQLRQQVGRILRELCDQRGVELIEGKAMADHVHLCLSIPPKCSVAHIRSVF